MAESLKSKAYRDISRRILSGELVPGEFLNRRSVAAELGMSPAPVLEAMILLETESLLETIPRKGTRVRIHRLEEVRGHFLVREALECQVARTVFGQPVKDNFDELAALARKVDEMRGMNQLHLWEAEVAFHCALADLVHNPILTEALRKSLRADLFYKLRYVVNRNGSERRSHLKLLEKLCDAPDAVSAENICRSDLRHGRAGQFMNNYLEKETENDA
ncbi:MAG: GntR family transcriptional regulator [Verrucomicrobiota bacterium]